VQFFQPGKLGWKPQALAVSTINTWPYLQIHFKAPGLPVICSVKVVFIVMAALKVGDAKTLPRRRLFCPQGRADCHVAGYFQQWPDFRAMKSRQLRSCQRLISHINPPPRQTR
jgi:hypothetical protein